MKGLEMCMGPNQRVRWRAKHSPQSTGDKASYTTIEH